MRSLVFLVVFLAACSSQQVITQPSETVQARNPLDHECVADEHARAECTARGSDFQYGPPYHIRCSGVPDDPVEYLAMRVQDSHNPCVCNHMPSIERHRQACATVP